MAIPIQTVVNSCLSQLDAENSDRYTFDQDFLPAILAANGYVVSLFNQVFAAKKLSEESLKEITYMNVWQTSAYSRFAFDSTIVGRDLWTILSIHPKISCIDKGILYPVGTFPLNPAAAESVYYPTLSFRDSNYSCKRLTAEQWAIRNINPFMAGSSLITCPDLIEYAYTDFTNYVGGYTLTHSPFEIEIAPDVKGELISCRYLKIPSTPTLISQSLDFPATLTNLVVQLVMRYLSHKQGDTFNFEVSEKEVNQLVQALS